MRTSVLFTVLAVALVVGAACAGPDDLDTNLNSFRGFARGANVVPAAADTTPTGTVTFNTSTGGFSFTTAIAGVDSVAFYQVAAGAALPAAATAILCAGAGACATTSGTATLVGAATLATIRTSMRGYGTQVVFFTGTAQKAAGGAARGTVYPLP